MFCSTSVVPGGGVSGGYIWDPNNRGKPRYYVPAGLAISVRSVSIYNAFGSLLDTTTKKRNSNRFTAKSRSASQLARGGTPIVMQTVFNNGSAVCEQINYPTFFTD